MTPLADTKVCLHVAVHQNSNVVLASFFHDVPLHGAGVFFAFFELFHDFVQMGRTQFRRQVHVLRPRLLQRTGVKQILFQSFDVRHVGTPRHVVKGIRTFQRVTGSVIVVAVAVVVVVVVKIAKA